MPDRFETEMRKALDVRAHEVEVPDGLPDRTLAMARDSVRLPWRLRLRARLDAQRMRSPVTGYPRVLYVAGAGAAAVMLFVVGAVVTMPRGGRPVKTEAVRRLQTNVQVGDNDPVAEQETVASSGDAVGGQIAGVVSSGDASVDTVLGNTSVDADAESGDGDFSEDVAMQAGDADGATNASGVVGLTAGTEDEVRRGGAGGSPFLEPQLVRSADIQVAVRNFDDGWRQANDIASKYNGAIVDSKTTQVEDRIARGTVTMRVPSERLENALDDLRSLGTLARLDTSGDDIAEQVDDVKQRVREARTEEEQLLDLQRRAATVSEQLEVRRRLEDVRKNLDSLKDKQKGYEDQIDFALVRATIFQDESARDDNGIVLNAFDTASRIFLTIVAGILVVLAALLPPAVLALAIWWVVRAIRRRMAKTV